MIDGDLSKVKSYKKGSKYFINLFFSEEMLSILGIGVNLPSNVCLLTIMRILFPMPPEPQSVIKKATSNGGIEEANLENIDGQIKQGKKIKSMSLMRGSNPRPLD